MSDHTKISWATASWNPITGCSPISEGCQNCYANRIAKRLKAMGNRGYMDGFNITLHQDRLNQPMRWNRKPRTIFVCSMGDLFHEDVPMQWINMVFCMMMTAREVGNKHTFIVLTKRPKRMQQFFSEFPGHRNKKDIWLGVTAENQPRWDERVEMLLDTSAAHRFVSIEPMLERIYVGKHASRLDWIIVGGESGPRARPMEEDWARDVLHQCDVAGVPFHLKQYSGFRPEKCPELDGQRFTAMPPF